MRCRASTCEAELTWAEGSAGQSIPLVRITLAEWQALPRRATLYVIVARDDSVGRATALIVPEPERAAPDVPLYLNHFVNCTARESFRRRR